MSTVSRSTISPRAIRPILSVRFGILSLRLVHMIDHMHLRYVRRHVHDLDPRLSKAEERNRFPDLSAVQNHPAITTPTRFINCSPLIFPAVL